MIQKSSRSTEQVPSFVEEELLLSLQLLQRFDRACCRSSSENPINCKSTAYHYWEDLSLIVGQVIPDLNYTVTGWKHDDANFALGANPATLDNIELWLDAADISTITEDSGLVSQWSDKSGNNYHATQYESPQKPRFNLSDEYLNYKPAITSHSNSGSIGFNLQDMHGLFRKSM